MTIELASAEPRVVISWVSSRTWPAIGPPAHSTSPTGAGTERPHEGHSGQDGRRARPQPAQRRGRAARAPEVRTTSSAARTMPTPTATTPTTQVAAEDIDRAADSQLIDLNLKSVLP